MDKGSGNEISKYLGLIKPIFNIIGALICITLLIISAPAIPVIFYLSILFNVIKFVWDNLKEL